MNCVRCGECCRRGGPCDIRRWHVDADGERLSREFEGACELLTATGECSVMLGHMDTVRLFFPQVVGTCDFPHLRVDQRDGDYQ